ncbi:PTS transporter subunit EIIB (plasmid) [Kitasatospora sp. NBC_00070]|uniref:PTS transporter subunit EIIB n=1 Tax=Kitasatospora sp. NBC_00070 TaxID=2975962 RepID=UPI002F9067A0
MKKAEIGEIIAGLGGIGNIKEAEGCVTRIRARVADPGLVSATALKKAGAFGVVQAGNSVQVVVGGTAETLAEDIQDLLPE